MKKFPAKTKWMRFLCAVCFVFMTLGFLFLSVDFVALNQNFYKKQFEKNNTARYVELSEEELDRVMHGLIDYFSGKSDNLQIHVTFLSLSEPTPSYTDDELSHMDDVKSVFRGFKITSILFLVISILGLITLSFFTKREDILKMLSRGAIAGNTVLLIILAVISVLLLLFFDPIFDAFHKVFFPQGNWQFSWDSNMLTILPESLFMEAAIYIALSGISFSLLTLTAGIIIKIINRRKIKAAVIKN